MSLTVDTRNFEKQLATYARELKKEKSAALKQQAGLLVKDALKATPPIAGKQTGKGTFTQSFAAQRRAGKKAIERDVDKALRPALSPAIIQSLPPADQRRARRYLRNGEHDKLATMMHRLGGGQGSVQSPRIHKQATMALHQSKRSRITGRVPNNVQPHRIQNRPSINKVKKGRLKNQGKWKAGWVPAARHLNVKGIPKWVMTQAARGYIRDHSRAQVNPSITLANTVRGETGRNLNIARAAIQNRTHSMRTEIQKRHAHAARKARLR